MPTLMDFFFRMAIVFYCVGILDLLGALQDQTSDMERVSWQTWIWEQYASMS
jgi:geranylgeranyl transferase type-1 subunit beta